MPGFLHNTCCFFVSCFLGLGTAMLTGWNVTRHCNSGQDGSANITPSSKGQQISMISHRISFFVHEKNNMGINNNNNQSKNSNMNTMNANSIRIENDDNLDESCVLFCCKLAKSLDLHFQKRVRNFYNGSGGHQKQNQRLSSTLSQQQWQREPDWLPPHITPTNNQTTHPIPPSIVLLFIGIIFYAFGNDCINNGFVNENENINLNNCEFKFELNVKHENVNCDFGDLFIINVYDYGVLSPTPVAPRSATFYFINSRVGLREHFIFEYAFNVDPDKCPIFVPWLEFPFIKKTIEMLEYNPQKRRTDTKYARKHFNISTNGHIHKISHRHRNYIKKYVVLLFFVVFYLIVVGCFSYISY